MISALPWHNRLAKWRVLLTGWQLGTRPKGDPESDAVSDHREATLSLRAEVTALTALMIAKGVFTQEEFITQLDAESEFYCKSYERRFPGFTAHDDGLHMDIPRAVETMNGWKP